MTNLLLFLSLTIISIPGILSTIPLMQALYRQIPQQPSHKKLLSKKLFIVASMAQSIVLVMIFSICGVLLSPKVNLHAPIIVSIISHNDTFAILRSILIPTLVISIFGAAIFLVLYYFVFRPRLDKSTLTKMEELRQSGGIATRVLYGGIVEEILCRWGLMTLIVWIISLLCCLNSFAYWAGILISGILFGLGHLPSYLSYGCKKTPVFIVATLTLNLWGAIIFGWLYWQYGLESAIIAHMLFHLLWYPIEKFIPIN